MNKEKLRVVLDTNIILASAPEWSRYIKKRLDIDALKKSRNYKGVNRTRFNQLVKEMNITEPIELLISQLSQ
jgi:hypothetical protein